MDRTKTENDEEAERPRKKDLKDAPRDQESLDEGLEESMDGSDPPSATQP